MATQATISGHPARSVAAPAISQRKKIKWGTVLRHFVLGVFVLVILLPLVWVILLSLKSLPDAYQNEIWPKTFDFSHYGYALQKVETLPRNYLNSILVTSGTVVVATICAILAGYAIVFLQVPGVTLVFALLVASMFFPTRVTAVIAIFETQKDLGLLNSAAGLILPYVTLSLALSVFVMRGMFQTVPSEIFDAARIDGAGPVRTLLGILLPMVKNGIVVVIVINFVTAWGEYLLARTINTTQTEQTLPVVLVQSAGGMGGWAWPRIAAVYIMAITPGLLAFGFAQRWYMKGLQEGALKA
jgi:ABC-type glycerol-3-phosphate transport system permease component